MTYWVLEHQQIFCGNTIQPVTEAVFLLSFHLYPEGTGYSQCYCFPAVCSGRAPIHAPALQAAPFSSLTGGRKASLGPLSPCPEASPSRYTSVNRSVPGLSNFPSSHWSLLCDHSLLPVGWS